MRALTNTYPEIGLDQSRFSLLPRNLIRYTVKYSNIYIYRIPLGGCAK